MFQKIKHALKKRIEALCANYEKTILLTPSFTDTVCVNPGNYIPNDSSLKGNIVFGPVPSRRLGYSLGINVMYDKACTYNCIYCQVGPTKRCSIKRDKFLNPQEVFKLVENKIKLLVEQHTHIDYISFVPNGEPTLDINLSKEIFLLRELGYKIAIFTNSSLLWDDSVKENLSLADYVSVKVDTVNEATWIKLNRPHRRLKFDTLLNGIIDFSKSYNGILTTETMLVKNINDNLDELEKIRGYLKNLKRNKSYFAIPVRPPAESYVTAPDMSTLSEISSFVKNKINDAEMLYLPKENDFKGAGSTEEELLGIMSVHPMTEEAITRFIKNKGGDPDTLKHMIDNKLVMQINYDGKIFYRIKHLIS